MNTLIVVISSHDQQNKKGPLAVNKSGDVFAGLAFHTVEPYSKII